MTFDRRAANQSFVSKRLLAAFESMKGELDSQLKKYTDGHHSGARVEVRGTGKVRITLWIHLLSDTGWTYKREDYIEVAELLLGEDMSIAKHSMDPHIYVAVKDFTID